MRKQLLNHFLKSLLIGSLIATVVLAHPVKALSSLTSTLVENGLSTAPIWTSTGTELGGEYAYSVAGAGDVNGDGLGDILIGAPKKSGTTADLYREGFVYAYYGTVSVFDENTIPNWVATGGQKASYFGGAVSTAGDVNGDGFDDILIGAYRYDGDTENSPDEGAAFVYHGSSTGLSATPDWTAGSDNKDAQFGYAVSTAGDVNGDGYDDVIVGAHWYTRISIKEGAAFVYYGSATGLSSEPDWVVYGGQTGAAFGHAVSSAGDVNGDGFDDVLVGAPGYEIDYTDSGAVYLYYGSSSGLNTTHGRRYLGTAAGILLGSSLGAAGDVNQDGFADFLLSAPQYSGDYLYEGAAYLYFGSSFGPDLLPGWTSFGGQESALFGSSVAQAGDINQDGFADFVIGSTNFTDDHLFEGKASIFYGGPFGVEPLAYWWACGEKADASFGFAVASAGDVNGDSFVDLLVGAPLYRFDDEIRGRAFLFMGNLGSTYDTQRIYIPLVINIAGQ